LLTVVLTDTEAVIEILKETGEYADEMCNRVRTVLLAPHKHKDREASKTKQAGNMDILRLLVDYLKTDEHY